MKILAITSSYPRFEGDTTAPFVESIVRSVSALGHEVHVLLPEHREWRRPPTDGPVHFHAYRYSPLRAWTPWGFAASLEGGVRIRKPLYALAPLVFAAATRAGRRLVASGDFDVVHAHWVVPNGPIGAVVAHQAAPLVVSLHGSDLAISERSWLAGRAAGWAFERAVAVTAPSKDLLERAARLGASGLLERVPYGVDAAMFDVPAGSAEALRRRLGAEADDVLVAGVGRLIPVKGFEFLLEAHAAARRDDARLRLVLVGDGDGRASLERRVRELGVEDTVALVGPVNREEVPVYMAAADIVAVPSIHLDGFVDGLPNVALEAMAAGTALVGSSVGGIPELVRDGENGLLVPQRDDAALAGALRRLAADPELRARLGTAGRNDVRSDRSWEEVGRRFVELYERAAGYG